MTVPTQQYSIVARTKGVAELVPDAPIPKLRDDYVLVRTEAVAVNPTDWKHIDYVTQSGKARPGCDYAGIVEEVGANLSRPFKKGDRIAGFLHGTNDDNFDDGAFAEYVAAKTGVAMHVPDNLSIEEAATMGVGISTVGQGLYQSLQLPLPGTNSGATGTILIYGGSTATGALAIQYAKLSGWKIVTTCSPRNFDLVKSFGADAAFDYNDPHCAKNIAEYTSNQLTHVFDCIGSAEAVMICANSIGPQGGKYSTLLKIKDWPRADVEVLYTLAYTGIGEPFTKAAYGGHIEARPEDYEFQIKFWDLAEKLIREGKIKPHQHIIGKDGLKGVLDGINLLREGKVSGAKLVYRVADTPK